MIAIRLIISQVNLSTPLSKLVLTCWPAMLRAMLPK